MVGRGGGVVLPRVVGLGDSFAGGAAHLPCSQDPFVCVCLLFTRSTSEFHFSAFSFFIFLYHPKAQTVSDV